MSNKKHYDKVFDEQVKVDINTPEGRAFYNDIEGIIQEDYRPLEKVMVHPTQDRVPSPDEEGVPVTEFKSELTPLEAFKRLRNNIRLLEENTSLKYFFENDEFHFREDLDIIESALKRLEEKEYNCKVYLKQMNTLVHRLAKYQKEHKAFEIIKEKNIDIKRIKDCKTIYEYSIYYKVGEMPTKEEFDSLKEVLK